MSTSIPKLTLFPLYPGGPKVQAGNNLNAYTSFYTQPTDFTPAYGVNVPPQTNRNSNDYFTIRSNQTLARRPVGEASNYSTALAVDGTILGNLKKAAVPPVAPVTPNIYKDAVELLSISDLKMADLLAQPSFRMNGAGMGFLVTTDGAGGVDTIELSPNSRSANPRIGVNDPTFKTPNMADITFRATPGSTIGINPAIEQSIDNRPVQNDAKAVKPLSLQNELALRPQITGLNPTDGIFQTGLPKVGDIQFGKNNPLNPVLERLLQLQPQDLGITTTGFDAAVGAEQSRQVATAQAGFDVATTNRFQDNVNSLKAAVINNGDIYKQGIQPQAIDGRIPMAPSLPQSSQAPVSAGIQYGASSEAFSAGSAGVDDTTSKKGRGGLMYFQMNNGSGEMGGGMGQPSPFASFTSGGGSMGTGAQNQQRPRRQPMSFIA